MVFGAVMHGGDVSYQTTLLPKELVTMMANKFLDTLMYSVDMYSQILLFCERPRTKIANKFLDAGGNMLY